MLIQTHKILDFPVVLMGTEFWDGLLDWMRERLAGEHMIAPTDLDLIADDRRSGRGRRDRPRGRRATGDGGIARPVYGLHVARMPRTVSSARIAQSSSGRRRSRLVVARRRFASSRRAFDALVGRVGRRGLAHVQRPRQALLEPVQRELAVARLRRASWATAAPRAGRSGRRSRAFCSGLSAVTRPRRRPPRCARSVTFACWPPGPEDRLARSSTSSRPITVPRAGCRASRTRGIVATLTSRWRPGTPMLSL